MYAQEKRSLFLEPLKENAFNPYQRNHRLGQPLGDLKPEFAGDGVTLDELNVKHGYQIGAGMIEWFLSRWMAGALHDPERAYRESYADFHAGNWPLLTISDKDKFSTDHGHAVLPYEWDPVPDKIGSLAPRQLMTIYVKNPNFPLGGRSTSGCRIEIDPMTWTWTFQFAEKEVWTGSGVSGGRLLSIPFTELNARPVTPGYAVLGLLAAGVFVVFGGAGQTEQITDGYGRTFFHPSEPGKTLAPGSNQINWDTASRIPNLMQVPRFGRAYPAPATTTTQGGNGQLQVQQAVPEVYYHRPGPAPARSPKGNATVDETFLGLGVNSQQQRGAVGQALATARQDSMHFQIRGSSHQQMHWTVNAPRMSATVIATMEPGVVDSIHLGGTGGHFQNLTVQFPNATKPRNVSVVIGGWRGEDGAHAKSFVLEGLSLDRNDSIRTQLSDGGKELTIENRGAAQNFTLRLLGGVKAETLTIRNDVRLDSGSIMRLSPSNWSPAASTKAPIRLDLLDKSGQRVLTSIDI